MTVFVYVNTSSRLAIPSTSRSSPPRTLLKPGSRKTTRKALPLSMRSSNKRPPTEAALILGAPSPQEKSTPWFGASLLFDIRQIDGISLHQEPNYQANDQEGHHINRENLKCHHGRFPAIEN
jgi:hypothetical protein